MSAFRHLIGMPSTESYSRSTAKPTSARRLAQPTRGHTAATGRALFPVSVVMTTHGESAATDITLASLCDQSAGGWELVVQTARSAEIGGEHPWVLFVDAGDVLHRSMLARIRDRLATDPSLDAVHVGWKLVDDDGDVLLEERCDAEGDLFDVLGCRPAFPSCACVVRRSAVEAAGGFDRSMGEAAEWVLWQRIARRGMRFGRVRDALITRRVRASRATPPAQEIVGALRAIALGHSADPVAKARRSAPHATGRLGRADAAEVNAVCAAAARALASGADAIGLVELLPQGRRSVDPDAAAAQIVRAAPLAVGQPLTWWATEWDALREPLHEFLCALERRVERTGLARAVAARMQRAVLPHLPAPLPLAVEGTMIGIVDVEAPIEDLPVGDGIESVQLRVELGADVLGTIELVPIRERVSAHAIRAAVAEEWSGRVLERFLANHPETRTLATALWERDNPLLAYFAEAVDRLASGVRGRDDGRHRGPARTIVIEAGDRIPAFLFGKRNIMAELRMAGRKAGVTEIVVGALGVVSRRTLRAALCAASEPMLTRIVVRDLVLGAPLTGGLPLHERTRALGAAHRHGG